MRSREELLARDEAGRRAATSEFRRPLVLEAGAGTGKTTTLVARIMAWCLGPGWEAAGSDGEGGDEGRTAAAALGGVVAITFTEAAAAEMSRRVAQALAALAAGREGDLDGLADHLPPEPGDELRRRRARALLGALDHLTVRTIHAFCRGLLATHPLAARLHPHLTVDADLAILESVARGVLEARLAEGYGDPGDPDLLHLAAGGHGPGALLEALVELAASGLPAAALERDPFSAPGLDDLRRRLAAALEGLRQAAAPLGSAGRRSPTALEVLRALDGSRRLVAEAGGDLDGALRLVDGLREVWPKRLLGRLEKWSRGELGKAEAEAAGEGREGIAGAARGFRTLLCHVLRLDPAILEAGRRALRSVLANVEREMRGRGAATFPDLLREARSLLADRPEVRRRERRRIRQLLVDEFQDTDHVQCEILRLLALDGPPTERPGLFVVGDPKQSIFGWRSADLEAYETFVHQVEEAGGETHLLARNFRSTAALLEEVRRAVEPVMVRRPGVQPRFEDLVPTGAPEPPAGGGSRAPVEYWVSWAGPGGGDRKAGPETLADETARIEATAVAADVRSLHDEEGIPWPRIALLFRTTSRLETFLEALRGAGVPFAVARDKQYYRRREVIEAAALVRTVINPADHLALLTFLRSAAVGVPDAALPPLWRRHLPRLVTELTDPSPEQLEPIRRAVEEAARDLPAEVPGLERVQGWQESLGAALAALAALRRSLAEEPPGTFLERLRAVSLLEATEAARYLGAYRLANLERFFRRLGAAMEARPGDWGSILRALRRGVAEAQEAAEARPQEALENAVQVLTIHGAKGLEFSHVYLVQLHAGSQRSGTPRFDAAPPRSPDEPWEYCLFGSPTPGWDRVEERHRRVEAAERVRTLYVAMTRARERLVLAGCWPEAPRAAGWEEASTHLDLLQSRRPLPGSLEALWSRCRDAGETALREAEALWRFPDLAAGPPARTAPREPFEPPAPEQIARATRELSALRRAARARAGRPFSTTPSEEAAELLAAAPEEPAGSGDQPGRARPAPAAAEDGRSPARLAGSAVHRILETWDLGADPPRELERQRQALPGTLRAAVPAAVLGAALHRADALLGRIAGGRLLGQLISLAPRIQARELPVLIPPGGGPEDPVGYRAGTIDLLYEDPATAELVVADYKTDLVEEGAALAERARAYRPQGELYVRAVQEALALPAPPRFELWFLWADRIWTDA